MFINLRHTKTSYLWFWYKKKPISSVSCEITIFLPQFSSIGNFVYRPNGEMVALLSGSTYGLKSKFHLFNYLECLTWLYDRKKLFVINDKLCKWHCTIVASIEVLAHGGGREVSASGSETSDSSLTPASAIIYNAYSSSDQRVWLETSVSNSMPTSAIIYDAYTSIIKK